VSDIFREVEEEVRKERLDKLWKQYGDYVVAAACLLVIGAAGIQLWRTYDERQRFTAADQYAAAEQMMEGGQNGAASDAFGHLADTAPSGYKELARLQHADALLAAGEHGDALGLYKQIASGSDPILSAVARVRSAWATVDYASRADVTDTLGPLTQTSSPWNPMAQEILAYWDYRSGDHAAAQREYDAIAHNAKAPGSLRERAAFMTTFLKAGGDKDYGTVPPPPKPANAPQQLADPGAITLPNTPGNP
jgi:hypothetical protein